MGRFSNYKPVPQTEDGLRALFKRYDVNNDGRLSKAELTNVFRELGSRAPGFRAGRVLHHADGNRDGFISEDELNDLVKYASKHGFTLKQ